MIILCFYVIILMDGCCWLSAQLRLGQTAKFYQSVNYVYRAAAERGRGAVRRGGTFVALVWLWVTF